MTKATEAVMGALGDYLSPEARDVIAQAAATPAAACATALAAEGVALRAVAAAMALDAEVRP